MFIELLSACATENFDVSLASNSEGHIKCVSLNDRPCQARPALFNIKLFFNPFTVSIKKFGGSSNTLHDPYA